MVDGYNVVGQSKSLSALRDAGDLAAARLMLHESVDRFCHANRLSPMVVWDARTGVGRAAREEPHEHMRSLMVVYTVDADMWIESRVCRMLAGADQRQFESIWVATSDSLLAQCVFAQGAMVVSSRVFLEELAVTDNAAEILGGGARRARGPRGRRRELGDELVLPEPVMDHSLGGSADGREVLSALRRKINFRNNRDVV